MEVAPAIPEDKLRGAVNWQDITWFGSYNAHSVLLDEGLCSAERCECYVVAYKEHPTDRDVRPDPEGAPNMCVGCTSSSRRSARVRELEKQQSDDGLTKKQAARQIASANRIRIEKAFIDIGVENLWTNVAFLRAAFKGINRSLNQNLRLNLDSGNLEELQRVLSLAVAHEACGRYIHDLGDYDVDQERVDTFLGRLCTPLQPGPGDSQSTGWEIGWNGDDEQEWKKVSDVGFEEGWHEHCRRSRVILRALESTEGKQIRAKLWRRYNELESWNS